MGALDQLNTWLDVIRNSFARIKKSSPETQETFQKCSQVLKDYVRLFRAQQILGSKTEEETKSIDLSEGVLTENFGLPVIVCGTKVDLLESSLAGKKAYIRQIKPAVYTASAENKFHTV